MMFVSNKRVTMLCGAMALLATAFGQNSPYPPKEIEPPANKTHSVHITEGPALEMYRNNEAIIRWTSDNPGGSDEHWGVIHYGSSPNQLTQTAKGHIRLNRHHSYTVFRVRLTDLKPGKTYYYSVGSINADGTRDNVASGVSRFSTPATR